MLKGFNLLLLTFCTLTTTRAELLIVKQTPTGFEPLSAEESARAGEVISPILLKYQWPMVIASDLTEEEQNELLTPGGEPYKEARFIEAKIRAHGGEFENYRVAFIPTSLYELFVIGLYFDTKDDKNPLQSAVSRLVADQNNNRDVFFSLLASKKPRAQVKVEVNNAFQNTNKYFFGENKNFIGEVDPSLGNAWLFVNTVFSEWLFRSYAGLRSTADINEFIRSISMDRSLLTNLITKLSEVLRSVESSDLLLLVSKLSGIYGRLIVEKIIAIEYDAAFLNKALLLRGTGFESSYVGLQRHEIERLAGSTMRPGGPGEDPDLLYSISFGNSLFAGFVRDRGASAYAHLYSSVHHVFGDKAIGYALLIDKKSYYQNRLNRLFFIPSLSNLTALFEYGGYFHPRTTMATRIEDKHKLDVLGFPDPYFTDLSGNIIITRDPLHQAELFSKFLAENSRIIQVDPAGIRAASQAGFAKAVIASQNKAAKFYKISRFITSKFKPWLEYVRKTQSRKLRRVESAEPAKWEAADA